MTRKKKRTTIAKRGITYHWNWEASRRMERALSILRDASQFQWYVIPLFAMVVLFFFLVIGKRNWNAVFAGLALWGTDWFFEIVNALVFHFTRKAPLWGAPGETAYP